MSAMKHAVNALAIAILLGHSAAQGAAPVGTAFTYQGQLKADGVPANGAYDLQFRLFDALSMGHQIGPVVQVDGLRISDGLFSVRLDFGAGWFGRDARWLEVSVGRPPGLDYVVMSPRQALTAAPYALYALDAPVPPAPDQLWVASGNDIHNTNSGKVGIGTETPTGLLSVESTAGVHGVWSVVPNIAIYGHRTGTTGTWPAVHGECDSASANTSAVRGYLNSTDAGADSAAVRGENRGTDRDGAGVLGLHSGSGIGVQGASTGADGTGVRGQCTGGTGVYGVGMLGVTGKASDASGWGGFFLGSDTYGSGQALMAAGDSTLAGFVKVGGGGTADTNAKLGILGGTDTEPAGGGYLVLGSTGGANISIDNNEIMARNNGAADTLYLNNDGGKVSVGSTSWMQPSLVVYGNGQGKMNAPLQVLNMQDSQGIAAWLANGSNFATAHMENAGSGEVLWLERRTTSGPFIVAYNGQTDTRPFQVDADGRTTVTVLQITGGADLSEQFRVGDAKRKPVAGMVVSIDPERPGDLVVSSKAYDRTVAGVISGAGGVKPGMMMGQADSIADGDHPVALTGRVWCLCETSNGPIRPGDMLTTSDVAGHAMKVTDYDRAHGAVIGKAMTSLPRGETGLVLVLVNLN